MSEKWIERNRVKRMLKLDEYSFTQSLKEFAMYDSGVKVIVDETGNVKVITSDGLEILENEYAIIENSRVVGKVDEDTLYKKWSRVRERD